MYNKKKKGVFKMKTTNLYLVNKLAYGVTAILTFVLLIASNSGSTFFAHEPKQPKSLDKFKVIK